jgi:hypothetical protein
MRGPGFAALSLTTLVVLGSTARAQSPMAETWKGRATEIQAHLAAGEWKQAERKAAKLGRSLMEQVRENEAAPGAFARVAAWRALALAEMGKAEDAAWFWFSALALSPEVADLDFGVKAPHWEKLRDLRPTLEGRHNTPDQFRVVAPKPLVRDRPDFPGNLPAEGDLVVDTLLTPAGRLRDPIVVEDTTGSSAKRYAALEALVRWRYTPATLDGAPIEIPFRAQVSFKQAR